MARFEGKEGYMTFMNSFVEEHIPEMRKFLDQLSVSCFYAFQCRVIDIADIKILCD